MAARGGRILHSRALDRTGGFVTRGSAHYQVELGTALLVSGVLLLALVVFVPRPDIILTNPQFLPAECDTENGTRTVLASFTLTNRGTVFGAMQVDLYSDSTMLTSGIQFGVPAKASLRGTLSGVVHDCAPHSYALHASYPASSG